MSALQVAAFGLATGSAMAYLWVAINNWRVMVAAVRRPGTPRDSLVFLAGPVLVAVLVNALHFAGAPLSGPQLAGVALVGLAADPAALPALLFALTRAALRRLRR